MLTVVCWKWRPRPGYRSTYAPDTVNTLRAMVRRHYAAPHEFVCVTDDPVGIEPDIRIVPIWDDYKDLPGPNGVSCYRRLKAFSAEAAVVLGPRFVSLDLDLVITGDLTPLWDRPDEFVIVGDTARNTPYNGSMFLLQAGTRQRVWDEFDPKTVPARTKQMGLVGSDQAWIGACLGPSESTWTVKDGVYSWPIHLKKAGGKLPADARIVNFHGRQDPWAAETRAYPWISEHYRR